MGMLQTPMVVVYKVARLTYWLGKLLIKVKNIALVNIVAGQQVVPELIQHQVTAENIAAELESFITDVAKYKQTRKNLAAIRSKLGSAGASEKAAREILAFLKSD
jgi:lipid-A-disaccharide synthase